MSLDWTPFVDLVSRQVDKDHVNGGFGDARFVAVGVSRFGNQIFQQAFKN